MELEDVIFGFICILILVFFGWLIFRANDRATARCVEKYGQGFVHETSEGLLFTDDYCLGPDGEIRAQP